MKYRKKPKEVEAIKYENYDSLETMREAWGELFLNRTGFISPTRCLQIHGAKYVFYAYQGDYVVKNDDGQLSVIAGCDFEKYYEQVSP